MEVFFIVSFTLLTVYTVSTIYNTGLRSASLHSVRATCDTHILRVWYGIRNGVASTIVYIRSDVFLKGLHLITYVALFVIRILEQRLVNSIHTLRSFRKERTPRPSTHKLARAHETEISDVT